MNVTKYICANIISLLGIFGLVILLSFLCLYVLIFPDYNFFCGLIANIGYICFVSYIYLIPVLCFALPIEILFHKITHNKFVLNIPFKNEDIKYTYNILFWIGITSSALYLIFYLWFVTR